MEFYLQSTLWANTLYFGTDQLGSQSAVCIDADLESSTPWILYDMGVTHASVARWYRRLEILSTGEIRIQDSYEIASGGSLPVTWQAYSGGGAVTIGTPNARSLQIVQNGVTGVLYVEDALATTWSSALANRATAMPAGSRRLMLAQGAQTAGIYNIAVRIREGSLPGPAPKTAISLFP